MFSVPDAAKFAGQDVFILGGGASLRSFDFARLRGRPVVGCNVAYRFGPAVVPVVLFSDLEFFDAHRFGLQEYSEAGGEVWTIARQLYPRTDIDWVKKIQRRGRGLHPGTIGLGFGGNSGCAAVNLALCLGAKRCLLLGMDCKMVDPRNKNFHEEYAVKDPENKDQLFEKFLEGWRAIATDLSASFPFRHIINLGPDSALPYFPKEDLNSWLSAPQMVMSRS